MKQSEFISVADYIKAKAINRNMLVYSVVCLSVCLSVCPHIDPKSMIFWIVGGFVQLVAVWTIPSWLVSGSSVASSSQGLAIAALENDLGGLSVVVQPSAPLAPLPEHPKKLPAITPTTTATTSPTTVLTATPSTGRSRSGHKCPIGCQSTGQSRSERERAAG